MILCQSSFKLEDIVSYIVPEPYGITNPSHVNTQFPLTQRLVSVGKSRVYSEENDSKDDTENEHEPTCSFTCIFLVPTCRGEFRGAFCCVISHRDDILFNIVFI